MTDVNYSNLTCCTLARKHFIVRLGVSLKVVVVHISPRLGRLDPDLRPTQVYSQSRSSASFPSGSRLTLEGILIAGGVRNQGL